MCFESEKERNLYYKIFGGYLFNELVPDYEMRVQNFFDLLKSPVAIGQDAPPLPKSPDPRSTHVSFDNHLYLFDRQEKDRGEFADILVQDAANKTFIAIEAKLHSNWSYEKDIRTNDKRHQRLVELVPPITVVPVLLVTKRRWDHVTKKESNEHSNYLRFVADSECRFRVILWEQIGTKIKDPNVKRFLESQLLRNNKEFVYRSTQDWFIQVPPTLSNE